MDLPPITGTNHPLPFEHLSPEAFETLCLWLLRREGFTDIEHLGTSGGEQGRDLRARRNGRRVAVQCKRVQEFGPRDVEVELKKLQAVESPIDFDVLFLVTCSVSVRARENARSFWPPDCTCEFWAGSELDERVKRHPEIVQEFFQLPGQQTNLQTYQRSLNGYLFALAEYCGRTPYLNLPTITIPALSEVYVPQEVEDLAGRKVSSAIDAFQSQRNTFVQGVPGGGKSSLFYYYALSTAQSLLTDGPSQPTLIPVLVNARILIEQSGSFSEALLSAITAELGLLLPHSLPDKFFDQAPREGTKWLVLIDGLDEVLSAAARDRLITSVSAHSRHADSVYRFVINSRPIPDLEVDARGFRVLNLRPFSPNAAEEFTKKWFSVRLGAEEGDDARFLERVQQSRIHDLSRVPLLLTMAAVIYERDRGKPLPTRRAGLYRRFIAILLEDEEVNRQTREQFRQEWDSRFGEAGRRSADSIFSSRWPLLQYLALRQESGATEDPVRTVVRYIEDRNLLPMPTSEQWLAQQSGILLLRTGLIVRRAGREDFSHTTFREYACASALASQFAPSAQAIAEQINKLGGLQKSREIVLFLLSLWSEDDLDCSDALQALLSEGKEGLLVAGAALVDNVSISPTLGREILDRLIDESALLASDFPTVLDPFSPVTLLGNIRGEEYPVAQGLEELGQNSSLGGVLRLGVALALRKQGRADSARKILTQLARKDSDAGIFALFELKGDDSQELLTITYDPDVTGVMRMLAAQRAVESGFGDAIVKAANNPELDFEGRKAAIAALILTGRMADVRQAARNRNLGQELSLALAELLEKGAHIETLKSIIVDPVAVKEARQAAGIGLLKLGRLDEVRALAFNPRLDRSVAQFLAIMIGERDPRLIRNIGALAKVKHGVGAKSQDKNKRKMEKKSRRKNRGKK